MIDYKHGNLFYKDGTEKQLHIVSDDKTINITNKELHFEQFELTESLCSQSQLRFGSCESSMIKFKISNVYLPMAGKWINVSMVLNGIKDDPFLFGRYKVLSDVPTADKKYRNVTAYDFMYDIINAEVSSWYSGLKFPMTLKAFRDSFFKYMGIEQEPVSLVNDSMSVEETIKPSELSGSEVIRAICEINGCFGHINRSGKFEYIILKEIISGLYPRNDLFPADDIFPAESTTMKINKSHYKKIRYEDYICKNVERLQIRQEENDVGAVYPDGDMKPEENDYIVEDNFLVYGKGAGELKEIAKRLYEVIKAVHYRPFDATVVGNPCFEVGEPIRFHTNIEIIESYILQRTIKGIQVLNDSLSAEGNERCDKRANSVQKSIIQLRGKTNTLFRNIEETRIEIKDVEQGLTSKITQTATEIRSELKNARDGLESKISQTATEIRSEVTNAASGLQSQITQNANNITQKVSKNDIVSEINQSAEAIKIKAQKIDLQGLVTANEFLSKYATIETLNVTKLNMENLIAQKASVDSLNAVSARLNTVESNYISAGTVKANYMEVANWTSAGYIKAERIAANSIDVSKLSAGFIDGVWTDWARIPVVTNINWSTVSLMGADGKVKNVGVISGTTTATLNLLAGTSR